MNSYGKTDFRLQRQLSRHKKQDPPPNRVKPIPAPIVQQVLAVALMGVSAFNMAVADMIAIAFSFWSVPANTRALTASPPLFASRTFNCFKAQFD
jgi:hypothetical protein